MALDADNVLKRFSSLEGKRGEYEGAWQQCADYVLPRFGKNNSKSFFIFDSTAPLALGRFSAALESILTPRTQKWHSLATDPAELTRSPAVAQYLDEVRDILFANRLAPGANFHNQMVEAYLSLGVFGTAVMLIDDQLGRGLRYQCVPLHEVYLDQNASGQVDTVFRAYQLTARQAMTEFGDELPESIRKDAEDPTHMDRHYDFIHGVFPRRDFDRRRQDGVNLPVASLHIAKAAKKVVRESGYRVMPYAVSRFTVVPGEVYGRSPAMEAMPDIVQVNAMKKTMLRAAEKMVDPPLLTPENDVLTAFSLKAGSINYGGLDDQGRQMVVPLQLGGNLPIGMEMISNSREVINEAFYINLFQILVDTPQKTATEVIERAQEKAQLLAPVMGRQQSEFLMPTIDRELDILQAAGVIPPPPEELTNTGALVHPKYETPMAAALDSRDGSAILQAFQGVAAMSQVNPQIMDIINFDEAAKIVIRSFGAPAAIQNEDEAIAQIRQARAEQEQQQAMMEQAQMAGGAIEGLASAEEKLSRAATMQGGGMLVGNA